MSAFNKQVALPNGKETVLADSLGYGAVVRDKDGDLWVKFRDVGWWCVTGGLIPEFDGGLETLPARHAPYTLYDRKG